MSTEFSHQHIYDMKKAGRHLEKFLADDDLLSVNSEKETNFYEREKV